MPDMSTFPGDPGYVPVPVAVIAGDEGLEAHVVHPADSASRGHVYRECDDPEVGRPWMPEVYFPDTLDYGYAIHTWSTNHGPVVECDRPECRVAFRDEEPPAPPRDPLWPNGGRPICREDGCTDPVYLAGLCGDHWARS